MCQPAILALQRQPANHQTLFPPLRSLLTAVIVDAGLKYNETSNVKHRVGRLFGGYGTTGQSRRRGFNRMVLVAMELCRRRGCNSSGARCHGIGSARSLVQYNGDIVTVSVRGSNPTPLLVRCRSIR